MNADDFADAPGSDGTRFGRGFHRSNIATHEDRDRVWPGARLKSIDVQRGVRWTSECARQGSQTSLANTGKCIRDRSSHFRNSRLFSQLACSGRTMVASKVWTAC
jgi:hypothetical protein